MQAKEAFGVVVRSIGLIAACVGAFYFFSGLLVLVASESFKKAHADLWPASSYFIEAAVFLLLGLYFLRGARLLVRFAYPDKPD